jgi:hypothetical protein
MYFVITMDIDTGIDGLGHIRPGRILDAEYFSALLKHTDAVLSVAFSTWDRAADYVEMFHPDFYTDETRSNEVAAEMADITTSELFDELIVRIRETNGLEVVPDRDIAGLVNILVRHLHPNFLTE